MNESTQVDHSTCAAAGCPMLGTNSRSTTGTNEWFCFLHFGNEGREWPRITAELNRLSWLVGIVRGLRALPIRKNWATLEVEARNAITLCQRGDLQMKPSENASEWAIRLEGILAQSCRDSDAGQVDRMERAEVSRAAP